jgi:hypothetical protein
VRRHRFWVVVVVGSWMLAACGGNSAESGGDDGGSSDADGASQDGESEAADGTVQDSGVSDTGFDQTTDVESDQGPPAEASSDATESGSPDSGGDSSGTAESGTDASAETGSEAGAPDSAQVEASTDASSRDAASEGAACTVAATWSMTVQTITAVPTFCQGYMDCTSCGILFNATSSLPTATTIGWTGVDPGGTICNTFSGTVTAGGQFTTQETDCSPAGDGTTFDGQIDVTACSMTATYVYVLSGCTITFGLTGTQ